MKLDFELLKETGVQGKSIGHLFTPLPTAKALYFYITQIGHYYCTHTYTIRRDYFSPILVICVKRIAARRGTCTRPARDVYSGYWGRKLNLQEDTAV